MAVRNAVIEKKKTLSREKFKPWEMGPNGFTGRGYIYM